MVGKLKSTEMVDNFMDPPPKQIKLGMVFIIYRLKKNSQTLDSNPIYPILPTIQGDKNDLEMTSSYKISIDEISLAVVSPNFFPQKTKISWEIF